MKKSAYLAFALSGLAFAIFTSSASFAYFETEPTQGSQEPEMNGIKMSQYPSFAEKWHLVTVRYRKDSNEMRFTYANDVAWKSLQSLNPDYPDGAVFAKIGMISEADPSFPSSIVPSGTKRFQFMVRDKAKYADTDGWGYALFDDRGRLFNDDAKTRTQACAACHRIVPERGYVFSRRAQLDSKPTVVETDRSPAHKPAFTFATQEDSKNVPQAVLKKASHEKRPQWQFLQGELQKHAFSGTLDEVVPLLLENSKKNRGSSILLVNSKNWSAVIPAPKSKDCMSGDAYYVMIQFNNKLVRDAEVCN